MRINCPYCNAELEVDSLSGNNKFQCGWCEKKFLFSGGKCFKYGRFDGVPAVERVICPGCGEFCDIAQGTAPNSLVSCPVCRIHFAVPVNAAAPPATLLPPQGIVPPPPPPPSRRTMPPLPPGVSVRPAETFPPGGFGAESPRPQLGPVQSLGGDDAALQRKVMIARIVATAVFVILALAAAAVVAIRFLK